MMANLLLFLTAIVAVLADPPPDVVIPLRAESSSVFRDSEYNCGSKTDIVMEPGESCILTSPGFHQNEYPLNANCKWDYKCENGEMGLSCGIISIEPSFKCSEDILRIAGPFHKTLKICGGNFTVENVRYGRDTKGLLFRFTTNDEHSFDKYNPDLIYKGFQCSISCIGDETARSPVVLPPRIHQDNCGMANEFSRIVGGEPLSPPNRFPWQARIITFKPAGIFTPKIPFLCGGSLISNRHIITAAHCMFIRYYAIVQPSDVVVYLGDYLTFEVDETERKFLVSTVKTHEKYNRSSKHNDIALLTLENPVKFNANMRPVCLPAPGTTFQHIHDAAIAGYGRVDYNGSSATKLQWLAVDIFSNSYCNSYKNLTGLITDQMICAGNTVNMNGGCKGDSGGPLLVKQCGDRYVLAGIISAGVECGTTGYPTIFTRVTEYLDWIAENQK